MPFYYYLLRPEAPEEVHIILIDPKGTVNTGDVESKHIVKKPDVCNNYNNYILIRANKNIIGV